MGILSFLVCFINLTILAIDYSFPRGVWIFISLVQFNGEFWKFQHLSIFDRKETSTNKYMRSLEQKCKEQFAKANLNKLVI